MSISFESVIIVFNSQIDEYGVYNLFHRFGEIYNITGNSKEDIYIDFATIIDDRITRQYDQIIVDGRAFSFRFNSFRNYPRINPEIEIIQPHTFREAQQIAENKENRDYGPVPDAASPEHILNAVKDENLFDVFRKMAFNFLCDMANVCKRFKRIAIQVFKARLDEGNELLRILTQTNPKLSLTRIALCLKTFSAEIVSLQCIPTRLNGKIIMRMFADYCPKLKTLRIHESTFNRGTWRHSHCLMPHIKSMHITIPDDLGNKIHQVTDFLSTECQSMTSLETLTIYGLRNGTLDLLAAPIHLCKLKKLQFYYGAYTKRTIDLFLLANPQVRKIAFFHVDMSGEILQLLPKYAPNIDELKLCGYPIMDFAYHDELNIDWQNLIHLRTLQLSIDPWDKKILRSLVTGKVPLKSLSLSIVNYNVEMIDILREINTIETFTSCWLPYGHPADDRVICVLQNLPRLSKINFMWPMDILTIKNILRKLIQSKSASMRFTVSPVLEIEHCEEFAELLEAHPTANVTIAYNNWRELDVS